MSYESKHIDGDVSVGRNTAIGGDATVQGKTHLKGNVVVDGWLEAKNIKGAGKGLYTTVEKLKAAYPFPHDGWWALVGVSLPAPIYVADGGEWVPTGQSGGNPTIDSGQYNEAVEKLQEDITKLQDDITDIEARNKAQDTNLTTLGDSVNSLQDQVNTTKDTANKANNKANEVGSQLNSFKDSKGENGGIAPLDEQGKVPSRHLPGYIDDVVDFYGISVGITVKNESIDKNSNDEGCKVVYDKEHGCFVLAFVPTIGESEAATYYNNWLNADVFGTASTNGRIPSSGKVFLCEEDGKSYRWSGKQLTSIGSDLALGHTSSTAFPGDEGAKLQEDMKQVEENRKNILSQNKQIVARSIVNVNQLFDLADREITFSVALDRCSASEYSPVLKIPGVVLTFLTESGWVSKQWTDTSDWFKENNWSDFGAGSGKNIGDIINVNALCGNVEYTLSTAIKAVSDFEKETGAVYLKSGIILTFKTAESDKNGAPVWLTYQFTREASDITPEDLKPWVAFGGGGSNVETSDKPEEGGKDALSTGGAYTMQEKSIGGFDEESDEEYIYYKAVNLNGGQIEDVVLKIPKMEEAEVRARTAPCPSTLRKPPPLWRSVPR